MLAIRCSRVFDGERFGSGEATVLVDGGVIATVEPGWPPLAEPWQIIEAAGTTLLPGLIDAHVHLIADSRQGALDRSRTLDHDQLETAIAAGLRDQLEAGVTTVRDLGDRDFAVVDHRDRPPRDEDPPEPTIVAAGPPLTSPGGHCFFLGGEVAGKRAIRSAIAERVERRVDVIKVMTSGGGSTPGTDMLRCQFSTTDLRLIVDLAHAANLPVAAHAHGLTAIQQAVEVGVDTVEHCSGMTQTGVDVPDRLVEQIADRDIAVTGLIPIPADLDVTLAPKPMQDFLARTGLTPRLMRAHRVDLIRRLHRRGVTVATGNDSGLSPALAHGRLHTALPLLIEAGLSTEEALAAATSKAAMVCGLGSRKGRVRRGYDADLVLVEGDPRSDSAALQHPRHVVVRGRPIGGRPRRGPPTGDPPIRSSAGSPG